MKNDVKYDYELQAWLEYVDGDWYVSSCGHTEKMRGCYACKYAGYNVEDVRDIDEVLFISS